VEAAGLTAELLLSHLLKKPRVALYSETISLTARMVSAFRRMVSRRARRVPLQYLTGQVDFAGLSFKVGPGCFIPRPETELLVEEAIAILRKKSKPQKILDIGTGCGAVCLALVQKVPLTSAVATEVSPAALKLARQNRKAFRLTDRIRFYLTDLFPPVSERYDLIVSNPPYVPTSEIDRLSPEVQQEPHLALDGGPDGLRVIRRILTSAAEYLKPDGWVLLELGTGQSFILRHLSFPGLELAGFRQDLSGVERVAIYRKTD